MISVPIYFRRILTVSAGLLFVLCALPSVASAQACTGWNTSLYLDAYYDENNWDFAVFGEGVDYDAGCCYHAYGLTISAYTPSQQTYTEYFDDKTGSIVGTLEAGATEYSATFWVGCYCINALVGFEEAAYYFQAQPRCPTIPDGRLGATAGDYSYLINPSGMSSDEVAGVADGFANWTAENAFTGLNAIYCPYGQGSCTNGPQITVAEGDAGSGPNGPNYARMIIYPIGGGHSTGGPITISSDPTKVFGRVAYKKFTQHELGHFHGMDHAEYVSSKTTVMRWPHGDHGNYLPDVPTFCDGDRAWERAQ